MPKERFIPADPLPSATILLVRQHAEQFQAYLLRRHAGSGFMAGTYVFPGGLLDDSDRRTAFWRRHIDLEPAAVEKHLGGGIQTDAVVAHAVAAIRETFEEAGILLAAGADRALLSPERFAHLRTNRQLPVGWLAAAVADRGWRLALSGLRRWAHWITPRHMPKRFDTRFFVARMPADQQCRPDHIETTHGIWTTPESALAGNLDGRTPLSPPTLMTLHEMLAFKDEAAFLAEAGQRTWGAARMPRLVRRDTTALILRPEDPDYDRPEPRIRPDRLDRERLPVGEPFTRLWRKDGLWHPVRR